MSSIAKRIAHLTPQQRKLIALRRQKKAQTNAQNNAIIPLEGDGPWPASVDQTALWFIKKLNPDTVSYNISSCTRMYGPLDPNILQNSYNHIVGRHEILRTKFIEQEGKPFQVVPASIATPITLTHVSHLPPEDRETAARAEIAAFVTPFDLDTGPLVRVQLIKLDEEDHVLQVMFDHTAIDWWSFQIFFQELWVGYEAYSRGHPPDLPAMPIQFRDFAVWRNKWLVSPAYQRAIAYWKQTLEGAPTLLDMPTDRPRPATPSYRGSIQHFAVPRSTIDGLRLIASKANCSSIMSLLAVTFSFFARYTGARDLLIGTTITNRDREETHLMIGYLLNILVLRGRLEENPSFLDLLKQTRRTVLEAFDHKDVPFRKLVEELNPVRDLSRMPLYQLEFVYITTGGPMIANQKTSELEAIPTPFVHENFKYDRQTSAIDLQVAFSENPAGMDLMLEYMTDLFNAETIRRMGHLILQFMQGLIAQPEKPVLEIPWLTSADKKQLITDWNQTEQVWPASATTLELIRQQARRTPNLPALKAGGQTVSYQDLIARADAVAAGLAKQQIKAEAMIGVHLNRGADLLPVLLGIWQVGAAYVPLDPTHPSDRLAFIAGDADMCLIIVEPDHATNFGVPTITHARLISSSAQPTARLPEAQAAACLIYTSGSTGRPKGVTITHSALANLLNAITQQPGIGEGERLLAVTTLAFDICGIDLFLPLINGATVVLADVATCGDGRLLAQMLESEHIDFMQATPATWQLLYESGWQGRRSMRVLSGGDTLPQDLARQLLNDSAQLWNLYGPTETTIWSTHTQLRDGEPVHLGRPIANTQCYVVDEHLKTAPAGVPGELLIGGQGLARGYWMRAGLCAERFIPDPFGSNPGQRLYRTGDLVKYRSDGTLLFLGRLDFQVKIRGYRIELGEIASVMTQHDQIDQAVVTAQPGKTGPQLVAYYLGESPLTVETLREHVSKQLPSYMVPSFFIHLDAWPLTPNGKINRHALPQPEVDLPRGIYAPPRNSQEQTLIEIWQTVLTTDRIGIHDSFFLLGGHSLLATQITARIRSTMGRELPLKTFFDRPTVAEQAQYLEKAQEEEQRPPMKPVPRGRQYPLSFSQERMWFLDRLDPKAALYNMPFPLSLKGDLDLGILKQTLQALVQRHESFRTRFLSTQAGPVQVISPHEAPHIECKDLRPFIESDWEEVLHQHMTQAATRPFDLEKGPVLRVHLFQTGPSRNHLLLVMHHIISDGWSMGILLREFTSLYRAFTQNQASPLNELRQQYVDYAVWQRKWLHGQRLEKTLAFWRETLAESPSSLTLPYDYPRPAVQTCKGDVHDLWLDSLVAESVESLSQRYGVTPFMTLLAVYAVLLNRYSQQSDLCIGTPVANRGEADTEAILGLFINTLVMRLDLAGNPSFAELLGRVRATTLAAFSHQDAPFEKVVDALDPERNTSMTPLFQTFFSLETLGLEAAATQSLPGLDMEIMDIEMNQAKFDLSLHTFLSGGQLRLNFEYNTHLFQRQTIAQFANHFTQLLHSIAQAPEHPISSLTMLGTEEKRHLLNDWNQTRAPYPREDAIQRVFEAQALLSPQATAIVCGDRQWTYAQTNTVANQYAQQLRAAGVGYQDVIALATAASAETTAMMIAILKLGAIYLPLDPEYPATRLSWMLADSKATLLIGNARTDLNTDLPIFMPAPIDLSLETDSYQVPWHPLQTAYIVYTSGSTGKPKGIVINHRSVLRLVKGNHYAMFGPEETILQAASLAFDAATFEIWGSLLNGGRMVIHANAALDLLPGVMSESGVTTAWLTSQLFNILLDEHPKVFQGFNQVLAGGEALSQDHVHRFLDRFPDTRLINGYGPTETTTFACCADLGETGLTPLSVPIGKPIANSTAYVLDAQMQPLPTGVFGELYLGGDGLATGYLARPQRTAQSFVPNPFTAKDRKGTRLYQTGDRVRWLRDGMLEFGNRLDRQVKLRGFRLELGEIETCLRGCETVRACSVRFEENNQRLIAYVVGPESNQQTQLREHLLAQLPAYMVPSAWAFLPSLPLTTNGKLDLRALANTPLTDEDTHQFQPPDTDTEITVATIWAELLKRGQVGRQDGFFQLGGHSLLATRAVARLRERLQLEVPLQAIFQYPKLSDFARYLDIGLMAMVEDDGEDTEMEEGAI